MAEILHPRTMRNMLEKGTDVGGAEMYLSGEALRHAAQRVREQAEREVAEAAAATSVSPDEVKRRYIVMPGKILIAKKRMQTLADPADATSLTRTDGVGAEQENQWESWGTILMVGDGYHTDYGTRIEPHPEWKQGARVMFNPLGGQDVDLEAGGVKLTLTMVPFRNVVMVDLGEVEVEIEAEMTAEQLARTTTSEYLAVTSSPSHAALQEKCCDGWPHPLTQAHIMVAETAATEPAEAAERLDYDDPH